MDFERLSPPPLWLFSAAAVPVYLVSILALLGGLALLVATPLPLVLSPLAILGLLIVVGAFGLPFFQSAARAHVEKANLWVHQARYELAHEDRPRKWTPSDQELRNRRRLLLASAVWALLMLTAGIGVWLGDRVGAGRAFVLSILSLSFAAAPAIAVYLAFERRWARRAALGWQIRRVERHLTIWETRMRTPLGRLGSLPQRVPDNAVIACFAAFLWLALFAFLGAETGASLLQWLAFPAWIVAGVAFLFGREPRPY